MAIREGSMFSIHLRAAWRNIIRHRWQAGLNIGGLAVGLACYILIMLWVQEELSFDRFHDRGDRLYRIYHNLTLGGTERKAPSGSAPMGPAILASVPQVENSVRFMPRPRTSVKYRDRVFFEEEILYADPSVFDVFTFPLVAGEAKTALEAPRSVVLTEETAVKYFGAEEPVGKVLVVDGDADFTVTGVAMSVPRNSHLAFDMLCSFRTLEAEGYPMLNVWGAMGVYTYLLLSEQAKPLEVEKKLEAVVERHLGERLRSLGGSLSLHLQPITSVHLHSDFDGATGEGDIVYVRMFSVIGLFILLIACINFINLSTARGVNRAREVSIRKAFGASRSDLIRQFLGESVAYSTLSLALAVILAHVALPFFNTVAGRQLAMGYLSKPWFIPGLIGLSLFVAVVAGSYPAFFLSSFEPSRALRDEQVAGISRGHLRRILVVVQFTIAVSLALGTVMVHRQLSFMRNTDLGFDPSNVVVIPNLTESAQGSLTMLLEEMRRLEGVGSAAASADPMGRSMRMRNFLPEGFADDQNQLMILMEADEHFIPTMGIKVVQGRNFSQDFTTDATEAVIINETAARQFGWSDPVGKKIRQRVPGPSGPTSPIWVEKTVIGVVNDFNHSSLHEAIRPVFISRGTPLSNIYVRISPENKARTVELLRKKWTDFVPNQPFDHYFLGRVLDEQYLAEQKIAGLTLSMTMVAAFLGCLGLFGMSAHAAERRAREIAMRKVVGASIASIVGLLSMESLILVAIAVTVGLPLSYVFVSRWLEDFAYRAQTGPAVFALVGAAALLVSQASVLAEALTAAQANPAITLRHE
jgi:putative ABC transport system permease protein